MQTKKIEKNNLIIQANNFINTHRLNQKNKWYPLYHIAAPIGWINDPNGFCFFNNKYHLFYQYYPYAAKWGPMHWGHVISDDLIHWQNAPVALAPDNTYDRDGCFSGSALVKDNKMYLLYTGHVDLPINEAGIDRIETQCLAVSDDGLFFEKIKKNPVIMCPALYAHAGHFRDPKMWEHEGHYYTVIGAQTFNEKGQVLLFESNDLKNWQYKNVMAKCDGNQGFMWECPNLAEIDGKDVFIFSPQGVKPENNKYLNLHQSGYMLGKLDYETGIFQHEEFNLLDFGFDFYAPQIMQTPDGRCIMIGWLNMWENEMPEQADGWAGMLSVVRELHICDKQLLTPPAKELIQLRGESRTIPHCIFTEACQLVKSPETASELIIDFSLQTDTAFSLLLRSSVQGKIIFSYDNYTGRCSLKRTYADYNLSGERETLISIQDNLNLRIFFDKSSIEIFINNGEAVFSTRSYIDNTTNSIILKPLTNNIEIITGSFYPLNV